MHPECWPSGPLGASWLLLAACLSMPGCALFWPRRLAAKKVPISRQHLYVKAALLGGSWGWANSPLARSCNDAVRACNGCLRVPWQRRSCKQSRLYTHSGCSLVRAGLPNCRFAKAPFFRNLSLSADQSPLPTYSSDHLDYASGVCNSGVSLPRAREFEVNTNCVNRRVSSEQSP